MERDFVDDLTRSLPISRRRRHAIERELRSHLEETRLELARAGWPPEEAEIESRARLGDPAEILEGFGSVYRPSRRRLALAIALAGAVLAGVLGGGTLASATSAHKAPRPAQTSKAVQTSPHCHYGQHYSNAQ